MRYRHIRKIAYEIVVIRNFSPVYIIQQQCVSNYFYNLLPKRITCTICTHNYFRNRYPIPRTVSI